MRCTSFSNNEFWFPHCIASALNFSSKGLGPTKHCHYMYTCYYGNNVMLMPLTIKFKKSSSFTIKNL